MQAAHQRLGAGKLFHLFAVACWIAAAYVADLRGFYLVGVVVVALLLGYEHWLVRGADLSRIDKAFFEVNSYVGLVLFSFVALDIYFA